MRLLLDAHVSGPRVGDALRARGHEVRALGQEPGSEGLDDEEVLALAAGERRILVTHDVASFPDILRDWAEADRRHAGVILVYGIRQHEFGRVVRSLLRVLDETPRQADWVDVIKVLSRRPS